MTRFALRNYANSIAPDGLTGYILLDTAATTNFGTGDYTFEAWIFYIPTGGIQSIFDSFAANIAGQRGSIFAINSTGNLGFYIDSAVESGNTGTNILKQVNWNYVVLTRTANTAQVYINGVSVGSGSGFSASSVISTLAMRLGAEPAGGLFMKSLISQPKIYSRGLSATEISNRYFFNTNNSATRANLIVELLMTEGSGTTIADTSGASHNCTIVGTAPWSLNTPQVQLQNVLQYSELQTNPIYTLTQQQTPIMGQTDPFGGTNAALIRENGAVGTTHTIQQVPTADVAGKVVTFSVFVKAKERTWAAVYGRGGGCGTYVNLSNGAQGTAGGTGYINSGVVAYTSGWYRVWVTYTTDNSGCVVYMATGDGGAVYTGDNTSGIFAFGFQLALGYEMKPYRPITNQPADNTSRSRINRLATEGGVRVAVSGRVAANGRVAP